MNAIRIIPRLDIKNGLLIKGINLDGLRVLGDPNEFANYYFKNKADEIMYIDSVATLYGTNNLSKFITRAAKNVFIPITVGGGIRSINDGERILKSGADKISINSAAIDNIKFIKDCSRVFGSSTITVSIECIFYDNKYYISKSNGRDIVNFNPVEWAKRVQDNGAGEILLTSVNKEGLKKGFDIDLNKKISNSVSIPVIAHGGAGSIKDVYDVIINTKIAGVAIASFFHYETCQMFNFKRKKFGNIEFLQNLKKKKKINNNIVELKNFLKSKGINVRL